MFTLEQIKEAHRKVRSGADFPAYIREIRGFGVVRYDTYVRDGHIDYYGEGDYTAKLPAKYEHLPISDTLNAEKFRTELSAHQQGKTDFNTFINMCAEVGIDKWIVDIKNMTCTYYEKSGREVLREEIPGVNMFI